MTHSASPDAAANMRPGQKALVLDATDPVTVRLAESVRSLQDVVRGNMASSDELERLAGIIDEVTDELRRSGTRDSMGELSLRPGVKGAGQTLAPCYEITDSAADRVNGHVTFTRYHLGADGAAHGGALAMWVDDVLGRLAFGLSERLTRTAFLHLEFHHVVPVGVPAQFTAWLDSRVARKRHLRCELRVRGGIAVEAHGLWVETTAPGH